jgi:hypothetical protein
MKKYVSLLLMVFLAVAVMFTSCKSPDDDKKPTTTKSVSVSPSNITLDIDDTQQFTATTDPKGRKVTWSSSAPAVATVDKDGLVTAIKPGSATISAKSDKETGTAQVTVREPPLPPGVSIVGQTLVDTSPKLYGAPTEIWTQEGTENEDGSYTFAKTNAAGADLADYAGGGAEYKLPTTGTAVNGGTYDIADYQIAEIHWDYKNVGESINVIVKNISTPASVIDVLPIPTSGTANQYIIIGDAANALASFKFVIAEAGTTSIAFQRNGSTNKGPATISIDKVVFTKNPTVKVSFKGGANSAMTAIADLELPKGRTVDFNGNRFYKMPTRPADFANSADGGKMYEFDKWVYMEDTTEVNFTNATVVDANMDLIAKWVPAIPPPASWDLELNPANWETGKDVPAADVTNGLGTRSYEATPEALSFVFTSTQRAIIPLSDEQVEYLLRKADGGVTIKIESTQDNAAAQFRVHLGLVNSGTNWNGTNTGTTTAPLSGIYKAGQYAEFSGNKSAATLGYLIIQAQGSVFTTLHITKATVEPGDTVPYPLPEDVSLNPADWSIPWGDESYAGWVTANRVANDKVTFANDKLTVVYDGSNRQAFLIPLSDDQIKALRAIGNKDETGVTVTLTLDTTTGTQEARFGLGGGKEGSSWDSTRLASNNFTTSPVKEYLTWGANDKAANRTHLVIQGNSPNGGAAITAGTLVFTSIKIEFGDKT